jgi:hypothetical protein
LQDKDCEIVVIRMFQLLDNRGLDASKPVNLTDNFQAFSLGKITRLCIMIPVNPPKYYLDLYTFDCVPDLQQGEGIDSGYSEEDQGNEDRG